MKRSERAIKSYIYDYLESYNHRETLRRRILPLIKGKRVLDIGSASGTLIEEVSLATKAEAMIGIELSEELISYANSKKIKGATFIKCNALEYTFNPENFDTIVVNSVLHEIISYNGLKDVGNFFYKIYKSLAYGGRLIIFDGYKNDDVIVKFRIKNSKKIPLFIEYLQNRGNLRILEMQKDEYITSLTIVYDFIHKCYYEDNWKYELKEFYYPINLETYILSLYSTGFKKILIKKFTETENLQKIKNDFEIRDVYTGKYLYQEFCNALIVCEK